MANGVVPIRIGLLYDFPQGGSLFADALRLGLDEVAASGRLDREIELVDDHARGLPSGSEHDIKRAFAELDAGGALAIIGPSISDNALIAAPLCDAARLPAINYSGGERTRSQWMFHYQVGSL
jgi:branched-chain amino acid transport system substrate-binding protein